MRNSLTCVNGAPPRTDTQGNTVSVLFRVTL
jgi:hypothetical protein